MLLFLVDVLRGGKSMGIKAACGDERERARVITAMAERPQRRRARPKLQRFKLQELVRGCLSDHGYSVEGPKPGRRRQQAAAESKKREGIYSAQDRPRTKRRGCGLLAFMRVALIRPHGSQSCKCSRIAGKHRGDGEDAANSC